MRYMILRKADQNTEAGIMPSKGLLEAMESYLEEMGRAGILQSAEGLQASSKGFRVKFSHGKPKVTDGPFNDLKELVAGFCIIQVSSRDEAVEWASRWPASDANGEAVLEIRPIHEAEDFGPEFTPELREREQKLREAIAERS